MIIPLRDINPTKTFPYVTLTLIGINIVIFIGTFILSMEESIEFYREFGMIPARLLGIGEEFNNYSVFHNFGTMFSSIFIHGGIMHVVSNMWILWLFGDNVEDALGHFPFLIFYFASGIAADVMHILINASSSIPTVGASGAVAGVMGAYLLMYPKAQIKVFVFLIIFFTTFNVPAVLFIGLWFVSQLISGIGTLAADNVGGIAFWAHIGGFGAGVTMVLLKKRQPKPKKRRR
jgi:membrane associated rhomboid family serine protease